MVRQVLAWIKARWRLLFLILVPLVLLPLPILRDTSVGYEILNEIFFKNFLLGSQMWLSCTYSCTLLDFRSHSIIGYIFITTTFFSNGISFYSLFEH
jgi:hypothetical protein